MCGLIGYNGKDNADVEKLKFLMLANITRGEKGTGFYDGKTVQKNTDNVLKFLSQISIPNTNIFIGHTRQPTNTSIKNSCCHPFEYGDIVMAHNGSLTNSWALSDDFGLAYNDYEVDSQILACCLSKNSNYDALQKLTGTASVIFTNKNESGTIYCFRKNDDRPLWRGMISGNMYISSLDESLKAIGCTKIKEFKTQTLYKITEGRIVESSKRANIALKSNSFSHYHEPCSTSTTNYWNSIVKNSIVIFRAKRYEEQSNVDYCQPMIVEDIVNTVVELKAISGKTNNGVKFTKGTIMAYRDELERVEINSSMRYLAKAIGILLSDFKITLRNSNKVAIVPKFTPILCISDLDINNDEVSLMILGNECYGVFTLSTKYIAKLDFASKRKEEIYEDIANDFNKNIDDIVGATNIYDCAENKFFNLNNSLTDAPTSTSNTETETEDDADTSDDASEDILSGAIINKNGLLSQNTINSSQFPSIVCGWGAEYISTLEIYTKCRDIKRYLTEKSKSKKANTKRLNSYITDINDVNKLLLATLKRMAQNAQYEITNNV